MTALQIAALIGAAILCAIAFSALMFLRAASRADAWDETQQRDHRVSTERGGEEMNHIEKVQHD